MLGGVFRLKVIEGKRIQTDSFFLKRRIKGFVGEICLKLKQKMEAGVPFQNPDAVRGRTGGNLLKDLSPEPRVK